MSVELDLDKRRLIAWSAAGVAALTLSGCGGGGGSIEPTPNPRPPAPLPPPAGGPSATEWEAFAGRLQGQLLRPGQSGYETHRRVANARFDAVLPQALVRCASAADVTAALAFARQTGLPLVPRGGGHGYVGDSTGPGLVIDLAPMNSVALDGEIAMVGAGATLADVYAALLDQGLCIASGSCISVGIAGITLGGGVGVIDRAYGLTCDALLSAQVATADGRVLDCDSHQHPELFWALRGGGGGNFGVLTSLRLQTHAQSPMLQFQAQFAFDDLAAVMSAWQAWPQDLPDQIGSQLLLTPQGGVGGGPGCLLWGYGVGAHGTEAALSPYWQGLLARIGRQPLSNRLQARSYREVMLGACNNLTLAQCHLPSQQATGVLPRVAMAASSDFFDAPLDAAGIQALGVAVRQRRGAGPGAVILNLMGGAIARLAPEASAFVHRRALFSAQYLSEYAPGTPAATVDDGAQWAHGMRTLMRPWSNGRAYQNYLDALITDPGPAYYGTNLTRLQQVKRSYDPDGLFKQTQGLGLGA